MTGRTSPLATADGELEGSVKNYTGGGFHVTNQQRDKDMEPSQQRYKGKQSRKARDEKPRKTTGYGRKTKRIVTDEDLLVREDTAIYHNCRETCGKE